MTTHVRIRACALVFVCLAGVSLAAQAVPPVSQALPVDPEVTIGQFDNGLKYYIRKNTLPAGRAELRLVVNVGSIVEDKDQLGLAHFVDPMGMGSRDLTRSPPGAGAEAAAGGAGVRPLSEL